MKRALLVLLVVLPILLLGCTQQQPETPKEKTIVQTAIDAGSFNTLVTAVQAAGLVDTLNSAGPFTVFAPTDAAFAALPPGTLDALLADKALLTKVLTYHVVKGEYLAEDVVQKKRLTTVESEQIIIDITNGVKVNGANVIQTDIKCSNGVIHVIDKVILPPSMTTS